MKNYLTILIILVGTWSALIQLGICHKWACVQAASACEWVCTKRKQLADTVTCSLAWGSETHSEESQCKTTTPITLHDISAWSSFPLTFYRSVMTAQTLAASVSPACFVPAAAIKSCQINPVELKAPVKMCFSKEQSIATCSTAIQYHAWSESAASAILLSTSTSFALLLSLFIAPFPSFECLHSSWTLSSLPLSFPQVAVYRGSRVQGGLRGGLIVAEKRAVMSRWNHGERLGWVRAEKGKESEKARRGVRKEGSSRHERWREGAIESTRRAEAVGLQSAVSEVHTGASDL